MMNRIKSKWSLSRILFVVMGLLVMLQAILDRQWIGIPFGLYFTLMGIFALGCAGGNCYVPLNNPKKNIASNQIEFEEVKTKQ